MIKDQIQLILKSIARKASKPSWTDLRRTQPISRKFGFERGTPIDRYYIEKFLQENRQFIKGDVMEIAEDTYTKKWGNDVEQSFIFHVSKLKGVTHVGDLTNKDTLPKNIADCFICTQTFNFIYRVQNAIEGALHILKSGGVLLATFPGISQISRYDMDRWGDYWRFTPLSAKYLFQEVFGRENVHVYSYGNVLSAISFLEGITYEELTQEELDVVDEDYPVIVAVRAVKS